MGIYLGGREYDGIYIGGQEFSDVSIRGLNYFESDTPGSATIAVVLRGRNYEFTFSVTDPDGIRSVTTATLTASDGTQANIMGDFARNDANTFDGVDSRRNARWRSGTMRITYVDAASGESRTVSANWSV